MNFKLLSLELKELGYNEKEEGALAIPKPITKLTISFLV